jgi:putative transposase
MNGAVRLLNSNTPYKISDFPGQKSLWQNLNLPMDEVQEVAKKFVLANCYDPNIAALQFTDTS